ncbi:CatB-related O-acetyltransferase [Lutimonas saemankumensis]|uniref:CatB-related O-acetyltransferase n=1 Tax=Lutimonas saemankumensis TaxID=483016 RepID=UPI001CD5F9E1|nr:CatB-related O-acetyltransferase [Lutimonas saemankumensis]MCA0931060.1 CatB-related O-acetyltransferase [Lutimonas saemankumensis]
MAFGINKKYFSFILRPYLFNAHLKRSKLLKKFKKENLSLDYFVTITNSRIGNFNHFGDEVQLINSEIGDHSYVNSNTRITHSIIGKYCSIGSNVTLGMGIHPTDLVSTHPAFYSNKKSFKTFADSNFVEEYSPIILGNDVWIGSNSIIMGGVKIGNGAIIAAGAVVTKDVKPYEIVGGIPAKHIKMRLDPIVIQKLEKIKWWDFEESWIEENYKLFLDKEKFLDLFNDEK